MFKTFFRVATFVLLLSFVNEVSADLVAHWRLDEGSGTTAYDSSGNGFDGTFAGTPEWVEGYNSAGAVHFIQEGQGIRYRLDSDEVWPTGTVTLWARADTVGQPQYSSAFSGYNPSGTGFQIDTDGGSPGVWRTNPQTQNQFGPVTLEWVHLALAWEGETGNYYYNGELATSGTLTTGDTTFNKFELGNNRNEVNSLIGIVDDFRIYDHALSEAEILSTMMGEPWPYAYGPDPADGAFHEDTWVSLSWKPGQLAVSHDMYLWDDFDVVNEATRDSDIFLGNQADTFYVAGFPGFAYPDGLVPGTTYYWRIDEVNDANPDSPWKGPVWSFSIPPKTAYHPDPADGAEFVDPNTVTLSWTPGFRAILHTVYFGDDFDDVSNASGGMPLGTESYRPGQLELEKVYYWRVDEFDGAATYKGDVWSFTTPGAAGNPRPSYGASDVGINAILSWTPADSATSHELYFGTDKETVRNATAGSAEHKGSLALGAESYDPGLLEADTTYYWCVDEVDGQGNSAKGPLWVFTTGNYLLIDDFENYTDDDPNNEAIWQHWIDGFGVADNGSQVGNLVPPYAEQTVVHGGLQSMPLFYTNEGGVTNSEATLTLTSPRDWTLAGVSELSVWFRGASGNAADPLYMAVSNSAGAPAIVAQDDPEAAIVRSWTQWRIPLQGFVDQGINLSNVDEITVGVGTKGGVAVGGSGTLYVDDIRLY